MTQNVLEFAVEGINERLTPRAGEAVFGEFLKSLGVDRLCNRYLPLPKSNRGYDPYTFIHPLLLMLHSGGKYLEDVRMIASDKALCDLLSLTPKSSAIFLVPSLGFFALIFLILTQSSIVITPLSFYWASLKTQAKPEKW